MIKTIIFDFGGVVSIGRFFPVVAENLSRKFGISKDIIQQNLYLHETEYMLGNHSTTTFWENVCKDIDIPYKEFAEIFGSSYEPNLEVIEYIDDIKQRYQIILHSDNFEALAQTVKNDVRLEGLFERMYFSNEIHLLKNDEASFRHVLNDINRAPEECAFIDDKEKNLIVPKSIHINTILFKDVEQLKKELAQLGVR